jgi:peptidoglycan/xylan/chitin deacetylase (PgdA/CDA1 family)
MRLLHQFFPDVVVVFLWHSVAEPDARGRHLFFNAQDIKAGISSFCSPEAFGSHLDFIARHFRVIDLSEAVRLLGSGERGFGTCAALTFDDGCKTVCEHAVPLLTERRLPACLFVNSELAAGGRLRPSDILNYFVNVAGAGRMLEVLRREGCLPEKTGDNPEAFCRERSYLRLAGAPQWPAVKDVLLRELGHTEASLAGSAELYAGWQDLALLDASLFSFGNHGAEHLNLAEVPEERVADEIESGAAEIERRLAVKSLPYAFPFGGPGHVTSHALQVAARRHSAVFSAYGGFNLPGRSTGDLLRAPALSSPDPGRLVAQAFPPRLLIRAALGRARGPRHSSAGGQFPVE